MCPEAHAALPTAVDALLEMSNMKAIRSRPYWLTTMLCVAVALLVTAARAGDRAKSPTPGTDDPVEAVAQAIAIEARESWEAGDGWPRSEANYADDHPDALSSRQALEALQRKLFAHPALDGYVKRQLLGYVSDSDLNSADRESLLKAVRVLPQVIGQPQPRLNQGDNRSFSSDGRAFIFIGRQTPYIAGITPVIADGEVVYTPDIEVLSTGTILDATGAVTVDRHVIATIRASTSELVNLRRFTSRANEPIFDLREDLAARIDDPPLRLALLLDDAAKRMDAGDPSYDRAIERFVGATDVLRRSRELPRSSRRVLIRHLEKLADHEKKWVRDIEVLNDTQFKVHHATVAWPPELMERAVLNLRGRNPHDNDRR